MQDSVYSSLNNTSDPGVITRAEIFQQPALWPTTLEIVGRKGPDLRKYSGKVVIAGAGSSAYAASAVAEAWKESRAIPTTDLVLNAEPYFEGDGILLSLARSGDSPESTLAVDTVRRLYPHVKQLAISCNANGELAKKAGVQTIILDPRTNDRSLVMTSSFSNLVLAGMALRHMETLRSSLPNICEQTEAHLEEFSKMAQYIATRIHSRITVLASRPMFGAAREAALKITEMTAGSCVAIPETFLGLRHGPMSFLRSDSLVLCFLSSDPLYRLYEEDLLAELRNKQLGYIVAISSGAMRTDLVDERIPANAPNLPDYLRTPFEIVFPQLLAYHLSLQTKLNPDNPSPDGVITRVVSGVRIHDA